jgi:hypothetical protein
VDRPALKRALAKGTPMAQTDNGTLSLDRVRVPLSLVKAVERATGIETRVASLEGRR